MDSVFISHSHRDDRGVDALANAFRDNGIRPWVSRDEIRKGDAFPLEISRAIASAGALVLYQTHRARLSEWVVSEIAYAQHNRVPIIVAEVNPVPGNHSLSFLATQAAAVVRKNLGSPSRFHNQVVTTTKDKLRRAGPVLAILNSKGGVGKTSLSANVFFTLACMKPARVLLIDLDPQHNLTQMILPQGEMDDLQESEQTIIGAFEPSKITNAASPSADFTILNTDESYEPPSPPDIAWRGSHSRLQGAFDLVCGQVATVKYTVRHSPEKLQVCKNRFMQFVSTARSQYDCVVIDCNPSFSFLTECALETCSHIISPVTPDTFALRGLVALRNITTALYPTVVPDQLVLVNSFKRGSAPSDVETQLRTSRNYGERTLSARIPESAYMKTPNRDDAPENPLDTLAYARSGPYSDEMHAALEAVAEELAFRVGIRG